MSHLPPTGSVLETAAELRSRGIGIVWITPGSKTPNRRGWTLASQEPGDYHPGDNLGILTGRLSRDIVCVDLDNSEAVNLADRILPPTAMIDGRPGKPRSHRYYRVFDISPELQADCPSAITLGRGPRSKRYLPAIELLGTGRQAVCAPSIHPSGEHREWDAGNIGDPANVDAGELYAAVERLAANSGWRPRRRSSSNSEIFTHSHAVESMPERIGRAVAYLAQIPGAIQGQDGSGVTMWAARVLVWGFLIPREVSLELLQRNYNPRCFPPWSDDELLHKLRDAEQTTFDKPHGWLLTWQPPLRHETTSFFFF